MRLCAALPGRKGQCVLVKVGANDGVTGDPLRVLLDTDTGWSALFIEPVPFIMDRLRRNFEGEERFGFEEVAIGPKRGEATFYYVDSRAARQIPNLPVWYDQLGSFDEKHILKHLDGALAPFIVKRTVETWPLCEVLEKHGIDQPDLLHVDTEGFDFEVLKTLDFPRQRPRLIFIEHRHLEPGVKKEMRELLRGWGYRVRDCGSDYIAVIRGAKASKSAVRFAAR